MLCWTDSLEIAISLEEKFPNTDPSAINFVKLQGLVIGLEEFDEGESKCGERVLEAIQMFWTEEKE